MCVFITAPSAKRKKKTGTGAGRGKPLKRTVNMVKKDFENSLETYKDKHPGHLYFETPENYDGLADDEEVEVEEVYTFELGHYGGVYNTFFKMVKESRKGNGGDDMDNGGWYSAIAAAINSNREELREINMVSLDNRDDMLEKTGVLDSFGDIMTDFTIDLFADFGEAHEV
jgi:hypothetical protein